MQKAVVLVIGALAFAPQAWAQADSSSDKWGPAPPGLPAGAHVAVVSGDPAKAGPFVIKVKMPAGYLVPPHWHPSDENLTLLSGDFTLGMGDKVAPAAGEALKVGGSAVAPAKMHHFARSKGGAVIQITSIGPFEITYINPADDPRGKSPSR